MNFLEKDLESIIWKNYERCEERGLDIEQFIYNGGERYRQMNLAPYGIADLVYIRYTPWDSTYWVQVIELKKGKVDAAAYMQAKRYQTAIKTALELSNERSGKVGKILLSSVLIGNEIEEVGDFVFALNADDTCSVFTYSYEFDGIRFVAVGPGWEIPGSKTANALVMMADEWTEQRNALDEEFADAEAECDINMQAENVITGDYTKALLVTAEGILFNEYLFAQLDSEDDGAN